jgi:hypothetical protein
MLRQWRICGVFHTCGNPGFGGEGKNLFTSIPGVPAPVSMKSPTILPAAFNGQMFGGPGTTGANPVLKGSLALNTLSLTSTLRREPPELLKM